MENAESVKESQVDSETRKQIEMLTQLAEQMRIEKEQLRADKERIERERQRMHDE